MFPLYLPVLYDSLDTRATGKLSSGQLDSIADTLVKHNAKSLPVKPELDKLLQVSKDGGLTVSAFEDYVLCDLNMQRQLAAPFSSKFGTVKARSNAAI